MSDVSGGVYPGINIFSGSTNLKVSSNKLLINKPIVKMVSMAENKLDDIAGIILNATGIASADTINVNFSTYIPQDASGNSQGYPMITFQSAKTLQQYTLIGTIEDWFWCWRGDAAKAKLYNSDFVFYDGKPSLPAPAAASCSPRMNYIWPDIRDPVAKKTGLSSAFAPDQFSFAGYTFTRTTTKDDVTNVQLRAVKSNDPDNKAAYYLANSIGSNKILVGITNFFIDLLVALITTILIAALTAVTGGAGTVLIAVVGPLIGAAVGAISGYLTTAADNAITSGSFTLGDNRDILMHNIEVGAISGAISGIRFIKTVGSQAAKGLIRGIGSRSLVGKQILPSAIEKGGEDAVKAIAASGSKSANLAIFQGGV
jgi:hypothetical protein